MSKFEWQNSSNMGMILIRKLNAVKMLEEICIWTGIKGQAETSSGDNQQYR
jgi:hypothetical protein